VTRKKFEGVDGREQNIYPTEKPEKMHVLLENLGETLYQTMVSNLVIIDEVDTDNWGIAGEQVTERRKREV